MEEITQNLEQPKKKSKRFIIYAIIFISMIALVAAILLYSSKVSITIDEALTVTSIDVSFTGYPGETFQHNATIENVANANVTLYIDWIEDSNLNNITYTMNNIPLQTQVIPGETNISLYWEIDSGSPIGELNGTLTFARI